jgi:hypothetical protein
MPTGGQLYWLVAFMVEVSRINPNHMVTLLLCHTVASRAVKVLLRKLALEKFKLNEKFTRREEQGGL